jgi:hypothetical protein
LYAWAGNAYHPADRELVTTTWGTEAAAAAAMARVAPSMVGDREFLRWYAKIQRHFVPPDSAAELMRTALDTDIRTVLPTIHVPMLVLARGWSDHELDREMASQIDGARFDLLSGNERATFAGDQDSMVDAIRTFIGVDQPVAPPTTLLRAVLFTDVVGSTEHLARVGDRAWRDVLIAHDDRANRAIEAHDGRVIKSTGDGLLATFEGPAQAVRAARAIADAVGDLGIEIRAGVHVGEIETRGTDVAASRCMWPLAWPHSPARARFS